MPLPSPHLNTLQQQEQKLLRKFLPRIPFILLLLIRIQLFAAIYLVVVVVCYSFLVVV